MVPWSPGFGSELMGLRPRVVGRGVGAGTCFPVGELVGKGCDSTRGKHSNMSFILCPSMKYMIFNALTVGLTVGESVGIFVGEYVGDDCSQVKQ